MVDAQQHELHADGVLSALQLTSEFPKVVLENFYAKSRNSVEDGKKERRTRS